MKVYTESWHPTGHRFHLAYSAGRPLCAAFDEMRPARASDGEEDVICGGFVMKNWRLLDVQALPGNLCKRCLKLRGEFDLEQDGLYHAGSNSESSFWALRQAYRQRSNAITSQK